LAIILKLLLVDEAAIDGSPGRVVIKGVSNGK
jgi:hypothetical protein